MGTGLLDTLYSECDGYIEFRVRKPVKDARMEAGHFFLPADVEGIKKFLRTHGGYDVWLGVATRDGKGGKKDNIIHIPAIWADLDWKTYPGEQEGASKTLQSFPIKPTIIVASGGGWHCYWLLKEPYSKEDIEKIESVLRKIAGALKGDPAATDASRILRVPNTRNFKYHPPREVLLQHCNGSRYSLFDFDFLPDPPEREQKQNRREQSETLDRIMQCVFMQHCREQAAGLSEPAWYAMITQLMKEPGGIELIHTLSKPYKGYKRSETDRKILQALNSTGPHSCVVIKERVGFECGFSCGVTSPAALAFKEHDIHDWHDIHDEHDTTCQNMTVFKNNMTEHDSKSLWGTVKLWISQASGKFKTQQLDLDLGLKTRREKQQRSLCLCALIEQGIIEKSRTATGEYRKINKDIAEMSILGERDDDFPLTLPLMLNKDLYTYSKDIFLISGETNSGKTALIYSMMWANIRYLQEKELLREKQIKNVGGIGIRYFSSEMHGARVLRRLKAFGAEFSPEEFVRYVSSYYVASDFHDLVDPDGINFIDYIQVNEKGEYFRIGEQIDRIHHVLNKGVAVIALQKKRGTDIGRGGEATLERPALCIALSVNKPGAYRTAKIVKAKAWRGRDPTDLEIDFVIRGKGTRISEVSSWQYEKSHRERRKGANYQEYDLD